MVETASNFTDLTQKVNEVNTRSNSLGLTYLISMVPSSSSSSSSNSSISDSRSVTSSSSKINEEKKQQKQQFKERTFILNYYPVDCSISIFEEFFPFLFFFLYNSFSLTYIFSLEKLIFLILFY